MSLPALHLPQKQKHAVRSHNFQRGSGEIMEGEDPDFALLHFPDFSRVVSFLNSLPSPRTACSSAACVRVRGHTGACIRRGGGKVQLPGAMRPL